MNKEKRKRVEDLLIRLSTLSDELHEYKEGRLAEMIEEVSDIKDRLEYLQSEEEEVRDNYPENLHSSEIYETMEAAVDSMETAVSSLDDAICSLEEI